MAKIFTRLIRKRRDRLLRQRSGNPLARLRRSMEWADHRWDISGPSRADLVNDPCVYCGWVARSWDHLEPLSKGGHGSYNLVRACYRCNTSKYSTPLLRFLVERAWRVRRQRAMSEDEA